MSMRPLPSRRAWLAGGVASLLAAPALAQRRYDPFFDDPPDGDGYDTRQDWPSRRRRLIQEDRFYDTRPQGWDPALDADPYGQRSGRRPDLDRPATPLDTAGADGAFDPRLIYRPVGGEPFPVPAFNPGRVRPEFLRRVVAYRGAEAPGTIVVDPAARHLYFVEGGGRAIRYGVGVGRQGFAWSGTATVNSKQAWPDWYPPKEMIARDPHLARSLAELQSGVGMAGGPRNPLGARALYLWQGGRDTLYRIHGTTEPWTIGTRASSGCIRMINQDAIDLYGRAGLGAEVRVLG